MRQDWRKPAVPLTGQDLYSGRLIRDRAGQWTMLAFRNRAAWLFSF